MLFLLFLLLVDSRPVISFLLQVSSSEFVLILPTFGVQLETQYGSCSLLEQGLPNGDLLMCLIGYSMSNGDKSWMGLRRSVDDYIRGVNDFLDKAFERSSQGNKILCQEII